MSGKRLTKSEIRVFKERLLRRKRALVGDVSRLQDDALRKTGREATGELSTVPLHIADQGTDSFEQEMSLGLMESEQNQLTDIELALQKIQKGTFGICEGCQKPIPKARLKAIPYAKLCVQCKKKEEERGI
jgi:RNA polymerase-binding protein DksA